MATRLAHLVAAEVGARRRSAQLLEPLLDAHGMSVANISSSTSKPANYSRTKHRRLSCGHLPCLRVRCTWPAPIADAVGAVGAVGSVDRWL
jgi:hypothetical protein